MSSDDIAFYGLLGIAWYLIVLAAVEARRAKRKAGR
jgi:hypothetical protein